MEQNTHLRIDPELVGKVLEIGEGRAVVSLEGIARMASDDKGLVHGGFTFALADYAAMVAVNEPNVVLGAANVRFVKPVSVGQTMIAEAKITAAEGKKRILETVVKVGDTVVLDGTMTAFVLPKHVLES